MPSPFPGMDPFLEDERLWPAFRHQLLACLHRTLIPGLADRYLVRVGRRTYSPEPDPVAPAAPEERAEEFIEIRDRGDRLVTLIDVVSPANKTTPAGRRAYLATRTDALAQGAGVVEIDLLRRGEPTLTFTRDGLLPYDQCVTVTRPTTPDRYELYLATFQKRLPKFKVPLAAADRDVVLDLSDVFRRAYDAGEVAGRIDYRSGPEVPVGEEARLWIDQLLREKGLRGDGTSQPNTLSPRTRFDPPDDEVSIAAYFLWQREGCPSGRGEEFWYRALEQLRQRAPSNSADQR